jgi:dynactin complex subunit
LRQEIATLKQEAIETQSNVTEKLRLENDLLISKVSKLESELKNIRSDYTKLSSNYESVNQFNSSLAARVTELETEIDHKSSE